MSNESGPSSWFPEIMYEESEDVDEALQLYETAKSHLVQCQRNIEAAKGKFEEINKI